MIISIKHNFVFLSVPKCASTSTEEILRSYGQLVTDSAPEFKHINYRRYERFLKPLIATTLKKTQRSIADMEVICLFREPVEWVHSWFRYRSRPQLLENPRLKANSTQGLSFEEFCREYVLDEPKPFARIGRQVNYVKDRHGNYGNVNVFRYEDYPAFLRYMSQKVGEELTAPLVNMSPAREKREVPRFEFLLEYLTEDYEFYNNLPKLT